MEEDKKPILQSVVYDDQAKSVNSEISKLFLDIFTLLDKIKHTRERSLALTKLEEASMWINKSIAVDQMQRQSEK